MRITKLFSIWAGLALSLLLFAPLSLRAQEPNMNSYITLTVKPGEKIGVRISAGKADTPIRMVSGENVVDFTVDTNWPSAYTYIIAQTDIVKVYGDFKKFHCISNRNNPEDITGLEITGCENLENLICSELHLTSLDVSTCTALKTLSCFRSQLVSLNVSGCAALTELNCFDNQLTSLNLSGCTALTEVLCWDNPFTTAAYDALYCSLPDRTGLGLQGALYVYDSGEADLDWLLQDADVEEIRSSNGDIAMNKEWLVYDRNEDGQGGLPEDFEPLFHGSTYNCGDGTPILYAQPKNATLSVVNTANNETVEHGAQLAVGTQLKVTLTPDELYEVVHFSLNGEEISGLEREFTVENGVAMYSIAAKAKKAPNMNSYITLTVKKGARINDLKFTAAAEDTPIRVVNGAIKEDYTVGTDGLGPVPFIAEGETLTVYGDLAEFDCSGNGENITGLTFSGCTALTRLYCHSNQLQTLDVSTCTALKRLDCSYNQLVSLDVSGCTALSSLSCERNAFTTEAFDALFCSLPDRTGQSEGSVSVLDSRGKYGTPDEDANTPMVKAANGNNAISKNWAVVDANAGAYPESLAATDFTGTDLCPTIPVSYIANPANGTLAVQDQNEQLVANGEKVAEGAKLRIIATPAEGYRIKVIKANDQTFTASPAEYTVPTGATTVNISAEFKVIPEVPVNIVAPEHGTLTVSYMKAGESTEISDGEKVLAGTLLTITAAPAEGYELEEIKADDQSFTESPAEYRIPVSATEVNISATFAEGSEDDENTAVESELLAGVTVGPNPFGDLLQVQHAEAVQRYTLRNALGQSVISGNHSGGSVLQLHTAHLPSGLYLLVLQAEDGVRTLKVMKQ